MLWAAIAGALIIAVIGLLYFGPGSMITLILTTDVDREICRQRSAEQVSRPARRRSIYPQAKY